MTLFKILIEYRFLRILINHRKILIEYILNSKVSFKILNSLKKIKIQHFKILIEYTFFLIVTIG